MLSLYFFFSGGGSKDSQFFPNKVQGGGVIKFPIFPKFKKVQIILGEGGSQENCGLFPLFVTFFNLEASLRKRDMTLKQLNLVLIVFKALEQLHQL